MKNKLSFFVCLVSFLNLNGQCTEPISMLLPTVCENERYNSRIIVEPEGGTFDESYITDTGFISNSLAAGTYSVHYNYTFPNGCDTTLIQNFVVVPMIDIDISFDKVFDCALEEAVTATIFTQAETVYWSQRDSFIGTGYVHTLNTANIVELELVNDAGCYLYQEYEVPHKNPKEINFTGDNDCDDDQDVLRLKIENHVPGSYLYIIRDNQGSGSPTNILYNGIYQGLAQAPNGCISTHEIEITDYRATFPSVNAGADYYLYCDESDSAMNGSYDFNNPHVSTMWSTNDGNFVSSPSDINPYINKPGRYYMTATHEISGCSTVDSANVFLAEDSISISQLVITQENNGLYFVVPVLEGGNGPYTLSWFQDGTLISEAAFLANVTMGTYVLQAENVHGTCISTFSIEVNGTTSTEENLSHHTISIFPNPVSDVFEISSLSEKPDVVEVFTLEGVKIFTKALQASDESIDISHLPAGMHLLNIQTNKGSVVQKITKL